MDSIPTHAPLMILLAILFGIPLLIAGSGLAAIQGRFAQELELPGSGFIPYIPWLAIVAYGAAVIGLQRVKKPGIRWIGFILATLMASTIISSPKWILHRGSVSISIKDFPSAQSRELFENAYPMKWIYYSNSSEGAVARVRRDNYSNAMASFLRELIARQTEGNSSTSPIIHNP